LRPVAWSIGYAPKVLERLQKLDADFIHSGSFGSEHHHAAFRSLPFRKSEIVSV
jgi:hypothetical protein